MTTPGRVRALRGATTVAENTAEAIVEATVELLERMIAVNGLASEDVVSIFFTATSDVTAEFPAAAARALGLDQVPLLCAREMEVTGAPPSCVRVLMHLYSERTRLEPVYLRGAAGLRPDLGQS